MWPWPFVGLQLLLTPITTPIGSFIFVAALLVSLIAVVAKRPWLWSAYCVLTAFVVAPSVLWVLRWALLDPYGPGSNFDFGFALLMFFFAGPVGVGWFAGWLVGWLLQRTRGPKAESLA
jgi:hypothetical protein